nr:GntR family transcriptional regulator [uncultured Blautia sp.]
MEILLSNSSDKPIYEQITTQIKAMIIKGTLKSGDSLPSMRKLAKELHVSVITAQRAYEELQRDGFIDTVAGKGTFVSEQNKEFIREENLRRIQETLEKAVELSKENNLSLEELTKLLKLLYEE